MCCLFNFSVVLYFFNFLILNTTYLDFFYLVWNYSLKCGVIPWSVISYLWVFDLCYLLNSVFVCSFFFFNFLMQFGKRENFKTISSEIIHFFEVKSLIVSVLRTFFHVNKKRQFVSFCFPQSLCCSLWSCSQLFLMEFHIHVCLFFFKWRALGAGARLLIFVFGSFFQVRKELHASWCGYSCCCVCCRIFYIREFWWCVTIY